jgi:hypothetical protein
MRHIKSDKTAKVGQQADRHSQAPTAPTQITWTQASAWNCCKTDDDALGFVGSGTGKLSDFFNATDAGLTLT